MPPALSLDAVGGKNKKTKNKKIGTKKRGTTKLLNKLKYKYTKRKPKPKPKPKKTMKILVIIVSHEFSPKYKSNIRVLDNFMHKTSNHVDYVGISSLDDFHNYTDIISFQHTIINPKRQFSKICDFITNYKEKLNYDWFIKIRPDVLLIENIPSFDKLSVNSINARARTYYGPKHILYGCSIGGLKGGHSDLNDCYYDRNEHNIALDDHIYIFNKNTIDNGAFDTFKENIDIPENEPFHSKIWKDRNIPLNVIGINMVLQKYNAYSGHIPKNLLEIQKNVKKTNFRKMFFN
jgi:hypothetical protein